MALIRKLYLFNLVSLWIRPNLAHYEEDAYISYQLKAYRIEYINIRYSKVLVYNIVTLNYVE